MQKLRKQVSRGIKETKTKARVLTVVVHKKRCTTPHRQSTSSSCSALKNGLATTHNQGKLGIDNIYGEEMQLVEFIDRAGETFIRVGAFNARELTPQQEVCLVVPLKY